MPSPVPLVQRTRRSSPACASLSRPQTRLTERTVEDRSNWLATAIESRKRTYPLPLFIPKRKEFAERRTAACSHKQKFGDLSCLIAFRPKQTNGGSVVWPGL